MTTLEDKLRELGGGNDGVVAERKPLVREKRAGRGNKPMRGAMKYVTAIALVFALIAFFRAGVLECRVMGEALSPRCLLLGASLSWPQPAKTGEGKAKRSAAK